MEPNTFHPFVLPFLIGAIFLFGIIIWKYVSWILNFSKKQRRYVLKNIISFRTLKAIWEAVRECLFHRNIFKTNLILGYMHFSFAFGWLMLIIMGKVEEIAASGKVFTEPWLGIFFKYFEDTTHDFPFKEGFVFIMDLLLLFVLSGVILAFIKRLYSRFLGMKKTTKHTKVDRIALISLWLIFPMRLFAESLTASIKLNGGFLTQTLGNWLSFLPVEDLLLPAWWIYSFSLGIFFIFMPFTRYMHIFTEMLLVFFRKWGVVEEDGRTGYTDFERNACSRCGICIDVCQLNTGAGIQSVQSVYFLRDTRTKHLDKKVVDNCLLCDRCVDACPVGLELTQIRRIYRYKKEFAGKDYYTFLQPEKLKRDTDPPKKILYFAGCMTHLTPGIISSMKKIFEVSGQEFHFLDEEKNLCCGKPLKQQGFLEQAQTLIQKNRALIYSYDADILVTSCPICYNSFMEDYNLKLKVMHHTQYINMLIESGKITLPETSGQNFSYHDPCEISRGHDLYEEPRNILSRIGILQTGNAEKSKTMCCGGSLGNTVINPGEVKEISRETLKNLTSSQPDILVTSCPLCKKTFSRSSSSDIVIKDIAEVVASHIS